MSSASTSPRKPTLWLAIGAVIAAIGVGVLWPLREVDQMCVLIYPTPPDCGGQEPRWVPIGAIVLLVALLCAMVVLFATRPAPRTALILLAAGMVITVALALGIVALSQTGLWNPPVPYPPVIVD